MEEKQLEVLVIEADPERIASIRQAMQETAFARQPLFARTLAEALQTYTTRQMLPPDLIFVNLSPGMTENWLALPSLRHDQRWSAVPILALSESNEQPLIRQAYQSGVSSYFLLPQTDSDWVPLLNHLNVYWRNIVRLPKPRN